MLMQKTICPVRNLAKLTIVETLLVNKERSFPDGKLRQDQIEIKSDRAHSFPYLRTTRLSVILIRGDRN
jgi:hypothetical protein